MILQLEINDKYTTVKNKYNVVAEWYGISQIKNTLPIKINELVKYINTGVEFAGYYWFDIEKKNN